MQVYHAGFKNPNGNVNPAWPQNAAIYFDEPDNTSVWLWSTQIGVWIKAAACQQVTQGHGVPTVPPYALHTPSLYTDLNTGDLHTWNVDTQTWI